MSTISTPHSASPFGVLSMNDSASSDTPTFSKSPISTSKRSRYFFKVLPLAGLAWAWLLSGSDLATVGIGTWVGFVLLATLLVATATDLAAHKIPNVVTYPALGWIITLGLAQQLLVYWNSDAATGLPTAAATKWTAFLGAPPLAEQWVGAIACFGIMFFVFLCSGGGGGDVKLATVIGASLGLAGGLTAIVATHVAAGCFALCWAIGKYGPIRLARAVGRSIGSLLLPLWIDAPTGDDKKLMKLPIPMSAFFMIGTLFAMYQFAFGRTF